MPLTSVLMGVYNNAPYVAQAIESILSQSVDDLELVIIDDGSTDGSGAICRDIARRDRRVRLIVQPNAGHNGIPAINRALDEAQAEFISRCDADDYWLPGKLESQLGFMARHPHYLASFTHATCIDEVGRSCPPPFPGCFAGDHAGEALAHRLLQGNFLCHSTAMFRRSAQRRIGYFRSRFPLATDHEFWLQMASIGDLAVINTVYTVYRIHANNASSSNPAGALNDAYNVILRQIAPIHRRWPLPPAVQYRVYLTAAWAAGEAGQASTALRFIDSAKRIAPLSEAAQQLLDRCRAQSVAPLRHRGPQSPAKPDVEA